MPSIEEVQKQVKSWPHRYIFWTEKEIRKLPKILEDNEAVIAVTSGLMNNATWLLVLTPRRLLFLNCGMFFGLRLFQIPLDRVQSIDSSFTLVFGSISVWDGASSFRIAMVLRSSIIPFVRATEEAIQAFKRSFIPTAAPAHHPAGNTPDIATQIAKLAQLKESGYLTEEEFTAQKKKLLG